MGWIPLSGFARSLAGKDSLFFEFLRIWETVRDVFPSEIKVKVAAENVASMDEWAASEISWHMGMEPYFLDPVQAVPLKRPRLCWTTERIEGCLRGIEVVPDRRWKEIRACAPYPSTDHNGLPLVTLGLWSM